MSLLQVPKKLHPDFKFPGRKPSGYDVEIDWSHPLADGLVGFYLQDSEVFDVVTQKMVPKTGNAPAIGTPKGLATDYDGSTYFVPPAPNDEFNVDTVTLTAIAVEWVVTGAAAHEPIIGKGDNQYALKGRLGGLEFFTYRPSAYFDTSYSPTEGQTFIASGTADDSYLRLYVDGQEVDNQPDTGAGLIDTSIYAFELGRNSQNTGRTCEDQNIVFTCIHTRVLSAAEIAEFHRDPFQVLKPKTPQLYSVPAAVTGGTTVNVPVGSITLSGQTPTVVTTDNKIVEIPVGAINLTGLAPSAEIDVNITVPVGSLSLTGLAPTVATSADQTVEVPVGSISLNGFSPTVNATNNIDVEIPAGSISLAGQIPTVVATDDKTVEVPTGSISLTGQVPIIQAGGNLSVEVPVGSITLSGLAPIVSLTENIAIEVPAGSVTLTGQAPTVVAAVDVDINVPTGVVSLTGLAPTVLTGNTTLTDDDIQNIVNAIFTYIVENGETFEEQLRLIRAEAAGKLLVSGTTVTIRDAADGKDRITATVDNDGQRTAVTTDPDV